MSVFITGASSGIGEACAHAFASNRFDLVLVARRKERLKSLSTQLRSRYGIQVHYFDLDVRNAKALAILMKKDQALFAKVDILINNAGLAKGLDPIQEGNLEDWDTMIDTNVKGLLYVTRAFL